MTRYYVLRGGDPVPCDNVSEWDAFMQEIKVRRVAATEVGEARVSTVFLGLDHNFFGSGPPLLYETLVFGGSMDSEMRRYATRAEALVGHDEVVRLVQAGAE